MNRSLRLAIIVAGLSILSAGSYLYGQSLRRSVTTRPHFFALANRVSALPESGIGGTAAENAALPDEVAPEETFKEVLRYVKGDYVDRVDDEKKLGFGAVRTMLAGLDDPKTRFYDPDQRKQLLDQINGLYSGIGATLTVIKQRKGTGASAIEQRRLTVVAPVPGGPADRAGLQPGDIITEIDGRWVIAYDPRVEPDQLAEEPETDDSRSHKASQAVARLAKGTPLPRALEILSGTQGRMVGLTVERGPASQPIKISVNTGPSSLEPVEFRTLPGGAGYLRVTQFNDRGTEAFSAALTANKVTTLVIDLRNNVGGPVTSRQTGALGSALSLVGKLAGPGQVGTVLRRGGRQEALTAVAAATGHYRLSVLVNGGTSNLAELVAAALKERAGATIFGSKTFGDTVYQKLVELREGAGMTVTTGKLLTSRGVDYSVRGVPVDVPLAAGAPRSDDAAVQRAAAG